MGCRVLAGMGFVSRVLCVLLSVSCLASIAYAQGLPQSPYAGPPLLRGGDVAAFNPLGASANTCDTIPLSSGMLGPYLPKIPNLELGFLYYFGNNVRTGRFTADYVLPFSLSCDSVLFGEAHAEGWDFWKSPSGGTNNRVDLSFGGGYRTMLGANTLLGVNGFYDTSRLFNTWYSSGGVGLEMAANVAGDDAIDLNFNWYGNLFNRDVLINAFRNKGNSFDFEVGYSHALLNRSLDLRLKLIGYQFDIGTAVQGWRGGADLTTQDGVFTVRYEHGHDRLNGDYNTVGGFVTVGCQLENLLKGESPLTMPEPVFKSPRDLRRLLGLKVKRDWHQPAAVVLSRSTNTAGAAAGCNTDRFLAAVSTPGVGSVYDSGFVGFPAVPYTCLDPTKFIIVEFDYAFGGGIPDPANSWSVQVDDSSTTSVNSVAFSAPPIQPSGHLSVTLNTGGVPSIGQSAFTTTATDPAVIRFQVIAPFTATLTITNVSIRFNQ